jgi:5-methylcytosine-specific restriction protein A
MAPRNPPWSRDELILALDLYVKHPDKLPYHDSREIKGLSAILGKLSGAAGEEFDKSETPTPSI